MIDTLGLACNDKNKTIQKLLKSARVVFVKTSTAAYLRSIKSNNNPNIFIEKILMLDRRITPCDFSNFIVTKKQTIVVSYMV
jgi:hypothetical protein